MTDLFFNNHKQAFWSNSNNPPIKVFELTPHITGNFPKVFVAVSQQGMSICLSYFVQKAKWLDFNTLNQEKIERQDYLWEQNCLECFFELNHQNGYLEMNSSPNGAYNFYTFDDYRTPNTIPPKHDNWLSICQLDNYHLNDWHTRHISVQFDDYFAQFAKPNHICKITKRHPTAILYQNGEPIYYAIKHASPPDFHNKAYWMNCKFVDAL